MRTVKIVLLTVFMFSIIPTVGSTSGPSLLSLVLQEVIEPEEGMTEDVSSSDVDWNAVMNAIIQVESQGNPRAVNGNQVGCTTPCWSMRRVMSAKLWLSAVTVMPCARLT